VDQNQKITLPEIVGLSLVGTQYRGIG